MSQVLLVSYAVYGLAIVYIIITFALKVRGVKLEQGIFISGMVLFLFATVSDFFFFSFDFYILPFEATGLAVLIFALCEAAAIFIATMKEVEATKENEKRLAAENAANDTLSRMKTDFLANISHEIRTPLTVVGNYARLTERQLKAGTADKKTTERQNIIFQETQRLSKLVDKLLDISVTKGGFEGFCPIAGITRQAAELLRPILAKNSNRLDIHVENDCPPVAANSDSILQVLLNLASNANRHVKNGKISIAVKQEGGMALFRIEDNGAGIPEELLGSVFERGVSGDGGTGLGLPIAKELIESYGGSIGIESGKEAWGTIVWFTLPLFNMENPEENRKEAQNEK
jgi:signal transduction histidine kinase